MRKEQLNDHQISSHGFGGGDGHCRLGWGSAPGSAVARAESTETQAVTDDSDDGAVESLDQGYCGDLEEIAAELGVDLDQLRQLLHDGATLEELTDEAGVDLGVVLEKVKERLRAEVTRWSPGGA